MERDERVPGELLEALVSGIGGVVGNDFVGLYLYGSAVSGGFDPGVSDVDLLAVTAPEVAELDLVGLDRMHDAVVTRYPDWRGRLEIVYVGRATLASFWTSRGSLAVISPGEPFHVRTDRVADWLQNWYLARETGVPLHGPRPTEVVPPIAPAEFVAATKHYAEEVRRQARPDAGAGTLAYVVLTMCRALRTVRTETQGSKQESAAWVRARWPEWAWLIDAALETRLSEGRTGFDDARTREGAETFIGLLGDEISRPTEI